MVPKHEDVKSKLTNLYTKFLEERLSKTGAMQNIDNAMDNLI